MADERTENGQVWADLFSVADSDSDSGRQLARGDRVNGARDLDLAIDQIVNFLAFDVAAKQAER